MRYVTFALAESMRKPMLGALVGGLLLQFIYRDLLEGANAAGIASLSFADNLDVWTGGFLGRS
jgi:hypothetical protein